MLVLSICLGLPEHPNRIIQSTFCRGENHDNGFEGWREHELAHERAGRFYLAVVDQHCSEDVCLWPGECNQLCYREDLRTWLPQILRNHRTQEALVSFPMFGTSSASPLKTALTLLVTYAQGWLLLRLCRGVFVGYAVTLIF